MLDFTGIARFMITVICLHMYLLF